jgi:hypothetical protein
MNRNINIINQWLIKYGGSPWRFNIVMLDNFDLWKNLNYDDVKELVSITKDCIICHYSLIPFLARYVGIDIRCIYNEVAKIDSWDLKHKEKIFMMFPKEINILNNKSTLKSLGYIHLKEDLSRIRKKFIEYGVIGIDSLTIKGGNLDLILSFNEEE